MTKLEKSARAIVNKCLEIKRGESVLILMNESFQDIAQLLFSECLTKSKNTCMLVLPDNFYKHGIHDSIARFMQSMDVIVALTNPSIASLEARIKANQNGARIASMPNITKSSFIRFENTDFKKISRLSKKLSDILSISNEVNITSANGTHLDIVIDNHQGYAETGLLNQPGTFSHLPAGMACISPADGKIEGQLVVDSGMEFDRDDSEKLVVHIKDGRAARITGGLSAKRLRQKLAHRGALNRSVIEFGLGVNDAVRINGNPAEDEKALGNIFISLGHNSIDEDNTDSETSLHGIVYKATVEVKGKKIIDRGRLLLD
ncbi:MAG TPA: hypothetical protein PLP19_09025 [bacterium]|nr:hypothetical protein [bacterium]HPN43617.1 hypothetical protein [bacterium]